MGGSRLEKMKEMVARFPDDARARSFLAHELFKAEEWAAAAEQYAALLALDQGDVGAAYKAYGQCLERMGSVMEAAEAYRRGIASAQAHGHEGLAGEIRFLLDELDEAAT